MRGLAGGAVLAALLLVGGAGAIGAGTTRPGRIAFALDQQGISRIYTIRADGTGLRRVTAPVVRQGLGGDSGPVWAPKGGRIAFERDLPSWGEDHFRINVVHPGAGRAKPLTGGPFDVMPTWSPDGGRIVFARLQDYESSSLFVVDSRGRGARRLTSGRVDLTPAWSPDGTKIAFARVADIQSRPDEAELFIADVQGSAVRRLAAVRGLAAPAIRGVSPAWSPDGKRIAFMSFQDENGATCTRDDCTTNGEIYVINADGSGLSRLTSSKTDDQHPTWSPDGKAIAFSSGYEDDQGHAPWLMVMPVDGGHATRVGRFAPVHDPAWSPASVR